MKNKAYSFDSKCYELAEHFLPSTASERLKNELAQAIQDAVEDYCELELMKLSSPVKLEGRSLSDDADELIRKMTNRGMQTMQTYFDGFSLRIRPVDIEKCALVGCNIEGQHEHEIVGPSNEKQN